MAAFLAAETKYPTLKLRGGKVNFSSQSVEVSVYSGLAARQCGTAGRCHREETVHGGQKTTKAIRGLNPIFLPLFSYPGDQDWGNVKPISEQI